MIDTQIQHGLGRAKNALQEYLIRKLLVPKVYLDAEWNNQHVDVLAIDRAGVGDVHAVRIVYQGSDIENALKVVIPNISIDHVAMQRLRSLPSHYRYVALVCDKPRTNKFIPTGSISQETFAEDGVGRIGILHVDVAEEDPTVQVLVKPERFRSSREIVELADRYVAEHAANWEIRE
jgi:hypothetical protein